MHFEYSDRQDAPAVTGKHDSMQSKTNNPGIEQFMGSLMASSRKSIVRHWPEVKDGAQESHTPSARPSGGPGPGLLAGDC
jgi:hypothetical protein